MNATARRTFARWITAVQAATAAAFTALHGFVASLFRKAATVLADYTPAQQAKAAELIEDGAIHQLRGRIYLAVSEDGTRIHRTATTGQCTCTAGLKASLAGRGCYHVAAARVLEVA